MWRKPIERAPLIQDVRRTASVRELLRMKENKEEEPDPYARVADGPM